MVVGGGTSIMPKLAPTLYEFVDLNNYLKITKPVYVYSIDLMNYGKIE
ncbi:MAG: hypothetical protein CM1200mP37_2500 [Chloroflexota bacterium]|nr:MAG: hypothetical protein CM1200mP37_2500 [Chloroflexota bacterium]